MALSLSRHANSLSQCCGPMGDRQRSGMGSKDQPQPTVEKLLQAHAVHKISVQYPVINIVATV
jgi:hypothetical protein